MNGDLYLTLAEELANGATEAHFRSEVSRAYYDAFHVARRLLQDVGANETEQITISTAAFTNAG